MTNGDSLLDRSVVEASQPAAPEKRHGDATVTVYNLGISHAFTVWCGVVKLGRVPEGHKFSLHLPPGKYAFRLEQKGAPRWLEAEDGGEYYLSIFPPLLFLEEHDVGEAESSDTTSVKPKDAPDVAKLDIAQLQAEPQSKKHR